MKIKLFVAISTLLLCVNILTDSSYEGTLNSVEHSLTTLGIPLFSYTMLFARIILYFGDFNSHIKSMTGDRTEDFYYNGRLVKHNYTSVTDIYKKDVLRNATFIYFNVNYKCMNTKALPSINDPEHIKARHDVLKLSPKITRKGIDPVKWNGSLKDKCVVNVFNNMFGGILTQSQIDVVNEYSLYFAICIAGETFSDIEYSLYGGMTRVREKVRQFILDSESGHLYTNEDDLVLMTDLYLFDAIFGVNVGTNSVYSNIKKYGKNLWYNNKDNFVYESLRLEPALPVIAIWDGTQKVALSLIDANTDPTVFGNDALLFKPSRPDMNKIVTWGTPLYNISSPHRCPGKDMSFNIIKEVVQQMIDEEELQPVKEEKEENVLYGHTIWIAGCLIALTFNRSPSYGLYLLTQIVSSVSVIQDVHVPLMFGMASFFFHYHASRRPFIPLIIYLSFYFIMNDTYRGYYTYVYYAFNVLTVVPTIVKRSKNTTFVSFGLYICMISPFIPNLALGRVLNILFYLPVVIPYFNMGYRPCDIVSYNRASLSLVVVALATIMMM